MSASGFVFRISGVGLTLVALNACGASVRSTAQTDVARPSSVIHPPSAGESQRPSSVIQPPSAGESQLNWLAREWAGGTAAEACGTKVPAGEFLWFPNGRYCRVVTPARGTVGLQLDAQGLIRAATWHRDTPSAAAARSVVDSLDAALKARGLGLNLCQPGSSPAGAVAAVVWESRDLLVHLSTITPDAMPPRIVAIAVDVPAAFPRILCKPIAPEPARPRARAALPVG